VYYSVSSKSGLCRGVASGERGLIIGVHCIIILTYMYGIYIYVKISFATFMLLCLMIIGASDNIR
jgi:hypothetical protein